MQRREAVQYLSLLLGGTIVGVITFYLAVKAIPAGQ